MITTIAADTTTTMKKIVSALIATIKTAAATTIRTTTTGHKEQCSDWNDVRNVQHQTWKYPASHMEMSSIKH